MYHTTFISVVISYPYLKYEDIHTHNFYLRSFVRTFVRSNQYLIAVRTGGRGTCKTRVFAWGLGLNCAEFCRTQRLTV